MPDDRLSAEELTRLIQRVFEPTTDDHALAVLVDLPDNRVGDTSGWRVRRRLAAGWAEELAAVRSDHGLEVALFFYPNVHSNNADLPNRAWLRTDRELPNHVDEMTDRRQRPMDEVLGSHQIIIAPTEFSTTAPLKVMAPRLGFRAATMPGFSPEMVPALRLDYTEVNRRVMLLKNLLDRSVAADFVFVVEGAGEHRLTLDLRHRTAHASGGLMPAPGTAGNLPSGEAYIVPYEGENADDPTASRGSLPVQFRDEVVVFEIADNVATGVTSAGPESDAERARLVAEPARGNIAELGLGVLADFGIKPIGVVLLDEKLGLHIAFGRSEHFGGQVGPDRFSSPEAVVHQDHVYLPEIQPLVSVAEVVLRQDDGTAVELMHDGSYTVEF